MYVNFRDYGDGLIEAGWSEGRLGSRGVKGESDNREENELRAVARARKVVRRRCLVAGLDHLLTLTYRENMGDRSRGIADLYAFVKRVQEKIPGWKWIAVMEYQERGAVHWHLAVQGWQNVELLRSEWRSVVGEGNIDVKSPKRRSGKYQYSKLQLAYYLTKYMTKESEKRELNQKRYHSAEGIEDPVVYRIWVEHPARIMDYLREVMGKVGSVWFSGCMGWAASWDFRETCS